MAIRRSARGGRPVRSRTSADTRAASVASTWEAAGALKRALERLEVGLDVVDLGVGAHRALDPLGHLVGLRRATAPTRA